MLSRSRCCPDPDAGPDPDAFENGFFLQLQFGMPGMLFIWSLVTVLAAGFVSPLVPSRATLTEYPIAFILAESFLELFSNMLYLA